jgi:hypothetical protein
MVAFLISSLRRSMNKRYMDLRDHLVTLAVRDGKRSDNGRVFLRLGVWEVRFSTSHVRASADRIATTVRDPWWRDQIIRKHKPTSSVCASCGGTGKVAMLAHTEVHEGQLNAAINAGILKYEDAYEARYALTQIRSPLDLSKRFVGMTSGIDTE